MMGAVMNINIRNVSYLILILFLVVVYFCALNKAYAFDFGIGTHMSNYKDPPSSYIKKIKEYGFNSVRDELPWNDVEKTDGVYAIPSKKEKNDYLFSSLNANGLSGVFVLDYGSKIHTNEGFPVNDEEIEKFSKYAAFIAERYKGKVKTYEVWNEWYLSTGINRKMRKEKPDDIVYFKLIQATSKAIKAIDPQAHVIAGGFNPLKDREVTWFDMFIDEGILSYIDGISIHPYSFGNKNPIMRTPEENLKGIDHYQDHLELKTGKIIPLYITEMGYPTNPNHGGVTEAQAANYIIKYTELAKERDYIKGVWWYTLMDSAFNQLNKESNFGILKHDESEKLSAQCLRENKGILLLDEKVKISNLRVKCDSHVID